MRSKTVVLTALLSSPGLCLAACPSADLNGDCFVDFNDFALLAANWPATDYNDFALMAAQWLDELAPDPCGMVWVYINDDGSGMKDCYGDPIVNGGFNGEMSKYETTNAQYCEFLNAALASGDIYVDSNIVYGSNGSNSASDFVDEKYFATYEADSDSQIDYNDVSGTFSARSRDGYSMANHPVVEVSWYGATAFCNYYGCRLPTEMEWQTVADYDGSYTYGCGTTIDQSKANCTRYLRYANPLNLSSKPYTSPVDYYPSYGYGMNDMAGNVWEWTLPKDSDRIPFLRGGCWNTDDDYCTVCYRTDYYPYYPYYFFGFRVCR